MELVENSFKLQDRTAIVVGECDSVNQAIGRKLTQLGTDVAFIHTNIDRAQKLCDQLMNNYEVNDRFGKAFAIKAELGKESQYQDVISRVAERFGGVDILIDNMTSMLVTPFKELKSLDALDKLIENNLKAPLHFTDAA